MLNKNELEKIVITMASDMDDFAGKSFEGKYFVIQGMPKRNGLLSSIVSRIDEEITFSKLTNCVIEGGIISCKRITSCEFYNVEKIQSKVIKRSFFENCDTVRCDDIDCGNRISESTFEKCRSISVDDGEIDDCTFKQVEIVYPSNTTVDGCEFSDIMCMNDCVVSVDGGTISDCVFENITLDEDEDDICVIATYGSPRIENCTFKNIQGAYDIEDAIRTEDAEDPDDVYDEDTCIFE